MLPWIGTLSVLPSTATGWTRSSLMTSASSRDYLRAGGIEGGAARAEQQPVGQQLDHQAPVFDRRVHVLAEAVGVGVRLRSDVGSARSVLLLLSSGLGVALPVFDALRVDAPPGLFSRLLLVSVVIGTIVSISAAVGALLEFAVAPALRDRTSRRAAPGPRRRPAGPAAACGTSRCSAPRSRTAP